MNPNPNLLDQLARLHRADLLARAEAARLLQDRPPERRSWRSRVARALVAAAARLEPAAVQPRLG